MSQSTAITTFLRIRPAKRSDSFFEPPDGEKSTVEVHVPEDAAQGFVNHKRCHWKFAFNGVLDRDASQEDVFERVAQPVIDSVINGFNGTIFAYGQTGSGKTYTLTGGASAYAERGIIPRTLSEVFRAVAANSSEAEHTVRVSYLEIYNEHGFDLLDPRQAAAAGRHGQINAQGLDQLARVQGVAEDDDGSVRLKGLSSHVVPSEEAAINLLFLGDTNRAVSETTMNAASSRSHCIFTICVEARPHGSTTVRRSKLHLVDLAGSERVGKSGANGSQLTEAININSSLHFLEMVIMALHEKQTKKSKKGGGDTDRHVPYRNSMLTSVLRDSLGGNCKTVMVATVHPAVTHTDESISTCKFAQRVAMVKNEVSRNEEVDHAALISRLKEENRALREAGGLTDDDATKRLSPEELATLHGEVRAFLSSEDPEATVAWGKGKRAARVRHAMWIMKGLLLEGWKPHHAPSAEAWTVGLHERAGKGGGSGRHGGSEEEPQVDLSAGEDLGSTRTHAFGEEESSSGGRDGGSAEQAAQNDEEWAQRREMLRRAADAPTCTPSILASECEALRVAEHAFHLFCTVYAHGQSLSERHREAKLAYRQQVERAQQVHSTLRAARDAVSSAKSQVEARRVSMAVASVLPDGGSSGGDAGYEWHVDGIMKHASSSNGGGSSGDRAGGSGEPKQDPEEMRLCGELQTAKQKYHQLADELKRLKQQCSSLQSRSESLHAACEAAFVKWWPLACEEHSMLPPSAAAMSEGVENRPPQQEAAMPQPSHGKKREAWGEQPTAPPPAASSASQHTATSWLALLNDPEAALAEFRASHWEEGKVQQRDELKHRLNEAYSGAKEAGERVQRKRMAVGELKSVLAQAEAAAAEGEDLSGGPADTDRLKAQLGLETTMYKGAVASLKELKAEIEGLQEALKRSQALLQRDFQRWHEPALAEARKRAGGGGGGGSARGGGGAFRERKNDGMRVVEVS